MTPVRTRSARRADRGEDRAAAGGERGGAQGEGRPLRELRRSQLLREIKTLVTSEGTQRHADVHPRRPVVHRDRRRRRRLPELREELAPRGEGWEYVESLDMPGNAERWASMAAEKLAAKSVEAGQLRSDPRADQSLAHDSRVDRPPHRARSRDRRRSQLRRHELRRAAGEDDRPAEVRPAVHEHPGRSHAGRLARRASRGTTKACRPISG